MPTRPRRSGRRSRSSPNASSPRTTFFDGSVRSTRRISRSGRRRDQLALPREHRLARGELVELAGIDRDRVRGDERAAPTSSPRLAHAERNALAPALGVEADDVVREQTRRGSRARSARGAPPGLRHPTQGMWTKCASSGVGPCARGRAPARRRGGSRGRRPRRRARARAPRARRLRRRGSPPRSPRSQARPRSCVRALLAAPRGRAGRTRARDWRRRCSRGRRPTASCATSRSR